MPEKTVGKVDKFFAKVSVAAVVLEDALKVGDTVRFRGATTDFTQDVESIQVEHKNLDEAGPGAMVGIKVKDRVRSGDKVMVVTE